MPLIAKTADRLVLESGVATTEQAVTGGKTEDLQTRLQRLTKMAKCVAFIKGSPQVLLMTAFLCIPSSDFSLQPDIFYGHVGRPVTAG